MLLHNKDYPVSLKKAVGINVAVARKMYFIKFKLQMHHKQECVDEEESGDRPITIEALEMFQTVKYYQTWN